MHGVSARKTIMDLMLSALPPRAPQMKTLLRGSDTNVLWGLPISQAWPRCVAICFRQRRCSRSLDLSRFFPAVRILPRLELSPSLPLHQIAKAFPWPDHLADPGPRGPV